MQPESIAKEEVMLKIENNNWCNKFLVKTEVDEGKSISGQVSFKF